MSSFLSYALFYTFFIWHFWPRGLCEGGGSSGNAYMYGGEGAKFTGLSLMTYRPLHNCFVMSSFYWISLFLPGPSCLGSLISTVLAYITVGVYG